MSPFARPMASLRAGSGPVYPESLNLEKASALMAEGGYGTNRDRWTSIS